MKKSDIVKLIQKEVEIIRQKAQEFKEEIYNANAMW